MKSRLRLHDLLAEAAAGLLQRPGRSALTMVGTVLGIGAFVAVLGLTDSGRGQIDRRFDALVATEVTVQQAEQDPLENAFPRDAQARVARLNGVVESGVFWPAPPEAGRVSATPLGGARTAATDGEQIPVYAVSPGALRAMHPRYSHGTGYQEFHEARREFVAVLGAGAAKQLGLSRLGNAPPVFVGGIPLTVVGIVDDMKRHPELLFAVLVPERTAMALWGVPVGGEQMLIETAAGAAAQVAKEVPLALRPDAPEVFKVIPPPDPRQLRQAVVADLQTLFLVLAALCLVVGAAGITNTTLVAALERVPEIGLRRALGALPRHIAAQFLVESTVLGAAGGLVGTSLGTLTIVAVAISRDWTAVAPLWVIAAGPVLGAVIGLAAGAYPALRASRVEPVVALQR